MELCFFVSFRSLLQLNLQPQLLISQKRLKKIQQRMLCESCISANYVWIFVSVNLVIGLPAPPRYSFPIHISISPNNAFNVLFEPLTANESQMFFFVGPIAKPNLTLCICRYWNSWPVNSQCFRRLVTLYDRSAFVVTKRLQSTARYAVPRLKKSWNAVLRYVFRSSSVFRRNFIALSVLLL